MNTLEQLESGALAGATRVAISARLDTFPRALFALADTLQTLDLSGNRLSALPDDFHRFSALKILFCSFNEFTRLPEVLGRCPGLEMIGFRANHIDEVPGQALPARLRWLILTGNQIGELPGSLGACGSLQKLMLAGNRLQSLPATMQGCERLELLRLSANRFDAIPDWLVRLPRLSWLGYSGNPCSDVLERKAQDELVAPFVRWDDLEVGEVLGSGASGVIHRAVWHEGGAQRDVAVKVFKGSLTSDGLPHSEMLAWLSAGRHPGMIGALGRILDHPQGADGLVMPLVDSSYQVLAGPPSMETCSRDVYGEGTAFSAQGALRTARCVAGAAAQLHARGILHGDLYAHNILVNSAGDALLGDFGASTFCGAGGRIDPRFGALDVRAFGCLLEELVARIELQDRQADLVRGLSALRDACLNPDPQKRPGLNEVSARLDALR